MLAAGLHGIAREIDPASLIRDDVYAMPASTVPQLPRSLGEALDALQRSEMAREWFGDDFVDHFAAMKRAELEAQALAVTDWEVARYLEAL
jgi:glutamine synthetase